MKLTGMQARQRTLKGWATRKRRSPSSHTWERPNGEHVRLRGFSQADYQKVAPALQRTDALLKPSVKTNIKRIEVGRLPNRRHAQVTTGGLLSNKSVVRVSPRTLNSRKVNPAGVTAHEIGHAVSPGVNRDISKNQIKDYRKSFDYRKKTGHRETDIQSYKKTNSNPLNRRRTRQSVNAAEDFAETFRAHTGLNVNRKSYWQVQTNPRREAHFQRYYMKGM